MSIVPKAMVPTMLNINMIRSTPTDVQAGDKRFHESLFRSYQILAVVRRLLELGTNSEVVLAFMDECEKESADA